MIADHDRRRATGDASCRCSAPGALISLFRTRGLGQPILGKEDHGPEHHMAKQGTPTMGGIAIVVAALAGWLAAHVRAGLPFSDQATDRVGRHPRHGRDGLPRRLHQGPQAPQPRHLLEAEELRDDAAELRDRLVAGRRHRHLRDDLAHPRRLPRLATSRRGRVVIWAGLIIWATTNAVNVTDGLDGLAGGSRADGLRRLHDHRLLGASATRTSTARSSTRSTWPCSPPPSPAPAWASCGSTPPRRGSSWATSARSASARRWRCWRSRRTPSCCCC